MKHVDWQGVYAPQGDALDRRVQQALYSLPQEKSTARAKRMWVAALAAALVLASAIALAAGLLLSDRMDARTAALQALAAQYGFTPEMESFFECEVSADGRTVIFSPSSMEMIARRLGVYTVTLTDAGAPARRRAGRMTARRSGRSCPRPYGMRRCLGRRSRARHPVRNGRRFFSRRGCWQ